MYTQYMHIYICTYTHIAEKHLELGIHWYIEIRFMEHPGGAASVPGFPRLRAREFRAGRSGPETS